MLGCEIVEKSKIAFRARAPGRRNPHSSSSPGKPDTWQRGVGDPMAGTWRDAKCKLPRRSSPSQKDTTTNQRIGPLESRMTRKCPVRFGGGRMEKDAAGYPSRLMQTGSRTPASDGTSPAAYPTRIVGSLKPFRWNPAGNQSRPVEPDQQPEASLAWWVGDHPCEA